MVGETYFRLFIPRDDDLQTAQQFSLIAFLSFTGNIGALLKGSVLLCDTSVIYFIYLYV